MSFLSHVHTAGVRHFYGALETLTKWSMFCSLLNQLIQIFHLDQPMWFYLHRLYLLCWTYLILKFIKCFKVFTTFLFLKTNPHRLVVSTYKAKTGSHGNHPQMKLYTHQSCWALPSHWGRPPDLQKTKAGKCLTKGPIENKHWLVQ